MKLETFFEKFDQFADAPDAVAKMRELVLHLAFSGQLVRSNAERKTGALDSILAESSINGVSKGPTSDTTATEILKISAGTSRRDFFVNEDDFKHVDLPPNEVAKFRLEPGDLLACRFNGNLHYVGRFSYYRGVSGRTQVNPDKLIRFRIDRSKHCPRYVCYAMNSAAARTAIESMCATTAGNIGLSAGKLKTVQIPLPPLAEQKRIVAKVDELMALCDRLETQQQERESRACGITRAALARFADAPTSANLDYLFHSSFIIPPSDLRKSILTLAVQGKLVPQDPNDEPAEATFPGLKQLTGEETDRPNQWALCTYRTLTTLVTSGSRGWKEFYADTGSIFVRTQNIKTDRLVLDDVAFVDLPKSAEGVRTQVLKDDILITITGANVTKAARVEEQIPEAYVSQHIALTRPRWAEMSEWLHLCFISHGSARGTLEQLAYGDKPGLNLNNIRDLVLPIPPLAEQRRIVAKVEQLMALVDALETQLAASRTAAANLLSALVAELTKR